MFLAACGVDYFVGKNDTPADNTPTDAGASGGQTTEGGSGGDDASMNGGGKDAGSTPTDAAMPRCAPAKPFGAPVLVASIDTTGIDLGGRLAVSETLVFFTHADMPPSHVFLAQRASATVDFGPSAQVPVLNTSNSDTFDISSTADGLTVYLTSNRDDLVNGTLSLFVGTRASLASVFALTKITTVPSDLGRPQVTPDGTALYYESGNHVMRAPIISGAVGMGVDVGLPAGVITPAISADELTIYYAQQGNGTKHDVYAATRATKGAKFGAGVAVPSVNTMFEEYPSWVSADSCQLWFSSDRTTGGRNANGDIYYVQRPL